MRDNIEDESLINEDGQMIHTSRAIFCLPLIKYEDTPQCLEENSSYFPSPDACVKAKFPVGSFSIDTTGQTLIVGTSVGTVEIWCMNARQDGSVSPTRLQSMSIREAFMKRTRSITLVEHQASNFELDEFNKPLTIDVEENETQDDLALLDYPNVEEEFRHKSPTAKISQIYVPRHLPVYQCGFITKQHTSESGTILLLWQTLTLSSEKSQHALNEKFKIVAMIDLPISAQCHPAIHFDGRRLIVLGQDHIGSVVLVYHVLSTRFDQEEFDEPIVAYPRRSKKKKKGGESGGVHQMMRGGEHRIKFVNQIRHVGLGGLEYFDSMLMTANERFVVVNTKNGRHVACDETRNSTEGLLVIDLHKHCCY